MVHGGKDDNQSRGISARELPIAVALDGDWQSVKVWLQRLKGCVWGFKVGSVLFTQQGPSVIDEIQSAGFKVFLDLKFHDIPNTVSGSVEGAIKRGVDLLTVHASGGRAMLESAAQWQTENQSVVAVTVLTSLDQNDLQSLGIQKPMPTHVLDMARLAMSAGIKGLVSSPQEVAELRKTYPNSLLVTPGVRIQESHDQKRTGTLRGALESGSSLVVLGRALTESQNWEQTWQQLASSLDGMSLKKHWL